VLAVPLPLERREAARSVFDDVKEYLARRRKGRPHVVHRIDRDTSGLVVFAADAAAQAHLKSQFTRRTPERVYLAVVHGRLSPESGEWRDRIAWDARALMQKPADSRDPNVKDAISTYRVVERLAGASLVEVSLVTGRQNQIRMQARLHGHPLVGEQRYLDAATKPTDSARAIAFARQALHAHRLSFKHPDDERVLRFAAPLPPDMSELIRRLRRAR
jgi:23S rRNA pseudouridine1911/1915/1917 synthase